MSACLKSSLRSNFEGVTEMFIGQGGDAIQFLLQLAGTTVDGCRVGPGWHANWASVSDETPCPGKWQHKSVPAAKDFPSPGTVGQGNDRTTRFLSQQDDPGLYLVARSLGAVGDDHARPSTGAHIVDLVNESTRSAFAGRSPNRFMAMSLQYLGDDFAIGRIAHHNRGIESFINIAEQ